MKTRFKILGLIFLLYSLGTYANIFQWQYIEYDYFTVFYKTGYENQAKEVMHHLVNNYDDVNELTGKDENYYVHAVIEDVGTMSNGYAIPTTKKIAIFTNIPTTNSNFTKDESWIRSTTIHEMTHISHLTNVSNFNKFLSTILGDIILPNMTAPMWVIEGITTYNESQTTEFEGNLNYGHFDGLISALASEDKLPNPTQAHYSRDYPFESYYLYGGAFFDFLANEYGEEKFAELFTHLGGNVLMNIGIISQLFPSAGIDQSLNEVYGKDSKELFAEWHEYERERAINWKISGEKIRMPNNTVNINSLSAYNGKLYYFRKNQIEPKQLSTEIVLHLVELDPKSRREKILKSFTGITDSKLVIKNDKIYFSLKELKRGFANTSNLGAGFTEILYSINIRNGKTEKLFSSNFKAFDIISENEVIYSIQKNESYGSEIWKYKNSKKSKLFEIDEVIGEMIVYDGNLIVVSKENFNSWNINQLNLETKEITPIINSDNHETRIKISGDYLYFTANYNKQLSPYRYNLVNNSLEKIEIGSYGVDGVEIDDKIYFTSITAAGERLFTADKSFTKMDMPKSNKKAEEYQIDDIYYDNQGNAFFKNFSYFARPYSKLILLPMEGTDALGTTTYGINYNLQSVDLSIDTDILQPLNIYVNTNLPYKVDDYTKKYEMTADISASAPIYSRVRDGLKEIRLSYNVFGINDIWIEPEHTAGIHTTYKIPNHKLKLNNYTDISNITDIEEFEKIGNHFNLKYSYNFDNSSINVQHNFFNNYKQFYPDFNNSIVYNIISETLAPYGFDFYLDYTFKSLDLKTGWWTPMIYFNNAYNSIYVRQLNRFNQAGDDYDIFDLSYEEDNGEILSEILLGVEGILEVYVSDIPVALKTGLVFSDGVLLPYPDIEVKFEF